MNRNRPILSHAQNLGDIGETTVQLIFKKFNWTVDIIKSDFGEDIDCNIFIGNTRTNYHLRCQVKSTTKDSEYVKKLKTGDYSVSVSSSLLKAWLSSYFPVFLIVYEEDSDLCYWTIPTKQILENPSKLEKQKPTIRVSRDNVFDLSSKSAILKEVKRFYSKFLRLEEAVISCKVTPVLMPNYRIIPFHHFFEFIKTEGELKAEMSGDYIELLPSWMTVLKRLDASSAITSIRFKSTKTDLEEFIAVIKNRLRTFQYPVQNNEWVSFIISPIEIQSENSAWVNELTFWESYSLIEDRLVADSDYNFDVPTGFLRQVSRRARSWDYCHCVHPTKDVAIQFFGKSDITPSIQNIDKIHERNVKGQLILWECEKHKLDELANILAKNELSLKLIEDDNELSLFAITTLMFDPFIGLYSVPKDWDSFENGSVRQVLEKNGLKNVLPGNEYRGEVPAFLEEALKKYESRNYTKMIVTDMEYIPGFPLLHNERAIQASRFQMLKPNRIDEIEAVVKRRQEANNRNFQIDFELISDEMWQFPIYELSISWTPALNISSKNSYVEMEDEILNIFNDVMPTQKDDEVLLKNTFEILRFAGEIGFESRNEG